MKLSSMIGFILVIGVVFSDPKGKKFSKKVKLLAKISKPVYKLPLLNLLSNDTTTPVPAEDECEVVWEDKVAPICHTSHHEVCEPDTKTHCHKIWEEECWEEDVEKCRPVQECHTESHEVCKTEYSTVCEEPHGGSYGRHKREVITKSKLKKAFVKQKILVGKRSAEDQDEGHAADVDGLETDAKESAEPESVETSNDRTKRGIKALCTQEPQRVCYEKPVEKCVSVPECHTEQVQRCKKVPIKVCEEVETQRCWDEPEEHCKYKRSKVATKYCHEEEH